MTTSTATSETTPTTPPTGAGLRVTILGGGSFGTAIANIAARSKDTTTACMWIRDADAAQEMMQTRKNMKYLPDFTLEPKLTITANLEDAVKDKDIIFVAVPSHSFREMLRQIKPMISGQVLVSLTKGIEAESFCLMSDIIQTELPEVAYGVLSGPNLAKEIMAGMPAGTVIASTSEALRHAVQMALSNPMFRVFMNSDVHGVELAGALKNIYAVAMGMAAAYKIGENARSLLLSRALAEMSRFAVKVDANPLTFLGLAGVGDLFATCNSPLSRNYQIGYALGTGKTLDQASKELGQTAEGINTIAQVKAMAESLDVYMPINSTLYAIIFEGKPPLETVMATMQTRQLRSDVEFVLPNTNPQNSDSNLRQYDEAT